MHRLQRLIRKDSIISLLILSIGFATWANDNSFFWRDDWLYLLFYQSEDLSLFRGNLASDIKPLFQYILFIQFYLFKDNFLLYQLVNTCLLACCALAIFHVLILFQINRYWSLFGALLLLLHPTNFMNALWIFQQCELIHLFMLLICMIFFKKYSDTLSTTFLLLYGLSLLLQNYFFPNGVLYPIMFIALQAMLKRKLHRNFVYLSLLMFAIHLSHAFYIQRLLENTSLHGFGLLHDGLEKAAFFFVLISNSIGRLVVPNLKLTHSFPIDILPLLVFSIIFIIVFRKSNHKELHAVAIIGLVFSSIILAITRYTIDVIPYYYTSLQLPFLVLIVMAAGQDLSANQMFQTKTLALSLGLFAVYIFMDMKGKKIFSYRNNLNKAQLEYSVTSQKSYQPFDDPAIKIDNYISKDGESSQQVTVSLYRELKSNP